MVPPGPLPLSPTDHNERRRPMAKTKTYPKGRVCKGKGCSTVLSTSNKNDICASCLRKIPVNERPYVYNDGF